MPNNCLVCDGAITPTTPSIKCCGLCKKLCHIKSTNLSDYELASLQANKSSWQCSKCLNPVVPAVIHTSLEQFIKSQFELFKNELMKSISEQLKTLSDKIVNIEQAMKITQDKLKLEMNELRNEVTEIKRNMNSSSTEVDSQLTILKDALATASQQNINAEEIINEVSDRQRRRLNVVIFGVNEQPIEMGRDTRSQEDVSAVSAILTSIRSNSLINNIQRLGRYSNNATRPRPIKITLACESDVTYILKNAKSITSQERFKNIRLSPDRTPKQIEHYKKLKNELGARLNNGESDLVIKYVNGVQRIVQLN